MATRWAICGTGNICNDFCTAIKTLPETEHKIVAVAARCGDKAAKFAAKFGIPESFGSYEALCTLEDVDVIYIGLIPIKHVELSLLYINAGKNILCEDPPALSLDGFKTVLRAVREKNVFYSDGFWTRHIPAFQTLYDEIESGSIGEVRMVQVNLSFLFQSFDLPRLHDKSLGAGALMETGALGVKIADVIFQERPEMVQSDIRLYDSGVDKGGVVIMRYSGDRFAIITLTDDTPMDDNFIFVRGTKANIKIPDFCWSPTSVVLPSGQVKEWHLVKPPEGFTYVYPNGQNFAHEAQAVRDALSEGLKCCPQRSHEEIEREMAILDQVMKQNGIHYGHNGDHSGENEIH